VTSLRQKHLVLILAREFASNLATPTLLTDEHGLLVFYNEAAEEILERPFSEAREMPLEEWLGPFSPRTREGEPLALESLPAGIALYERRAAHERFTITSVDGVQRNIAVTAFPLFAHTDELVGTMTIWWRE
jgi:PAS domain-containing protein